MPVNYFNGLYIVNKAAFEKLDPKTQQKIRDVVAKLAPSTTARLMNEEDTLTDSFRKEGMIVPLPTEADGNKAIAMITHYWEQWEQQQGPKTDAGVEKERAVVK